MEQLKYWRFFCERGWWVVAYVNDVRLGSRPVTDKAPKRDKLYDKKPAPQPTSRIFMFWTGFNLLNLLLPVFSFNTLLKNYILLWLYWNKTFISLDGCHQLFILLNCYISFLFIVENRFRRLSFLKNCIEKDDYFMFRFFNCDYIIFEIFISFYSYF